MKTPTELKFDKVVKEGFHQILKPLGFKKKGNNFYLQLKDLGQIINIQKSSFYSKDHIKFTINTGLFLPEHWMGLFYNQGKQLPSFPTEPECLIRKRVGELRNQHDTWYDLEEKTEENMLIVEMQSNLEKYILPYFERIKTKETFLNALDEEKIISDPIGRLIAYGELKQLDKAKGEYETYFNGKTNPHFLDTVKKIWTKIWP